MLTGVAVMLFVLLAGAAPAAQDPNLQLRDAAASGQDGTVRYLLSRTEQLEVDAADEAGWTPLMHAADAGHGIVVQLLLDAGASVNLKNGVQETALHLAARQGRTEVVRLLLKGGADFAARNADGRTPLFIAIERRRAGIIEQLHSAALVNSTQRLPVRTSSQEGETVPPVLIQWTNAPYTDEALKQRLQGTVVLTVLVRQDGSIGAVSVSKSLEQSLDQSAATTARTWKFEPARRAGKPVAVVVEIDVEFELPKDR
jgi:TonB family protein